MDYSGNPFSALTLIAAPAVLTNASSVLVMSTSNRLARTIDRSRELTTRLEIMSAPTTEGTEPAPLTPEEKEQEALDLRELQAVEQRTLLLVRALQRFYVALSGFAASAFVSIIGAVIVTGLPAFLVKTIEVLAVLVGVAAVFSVISGALILVRETRIAVAIVQERSNFLKARIERRLATPSVS